MFARPSVAKATQSKINLTPARAGVLQRKCACGGTPGPTEFESCHKKRLQRKAGRPSSGNAHSSEAPPIVHEVLRSPGQPLDAETRAFMEPHFGHDFSNVRVHHDSRAAKSARAVQAQAYTVARHIVFDRGAYAPGTLDGRQLIAHELAHVAQQGQSGICPSELPVTSPRDHSEQEAEHASRRVMEGLSLDSVSPTGFQIARKPPAQGGMINPFDGLQENPPGKAEAEEFRRATISVVRDPILAALHHDTISFLNRLQALDADDRSQLESDAAFMAEIHRVLRGMSFWIVQLILRFGSRQRLYIRQLSLALHDRNIQMIKDLLRTYKELRDPATVPGVREMLDDEFRADREHDAVLAIVGASEVGGRSPITASYKEAHYERPKGGGAYQMQGFTGSTGFTLARTASELRVLVRIHLVEAANFLQTFYPDDRTATQWRRGIEGAWNNRFTATNGTTHLRVIFVPLFTEELPDHTVLIDHDHDSGRSDEGRWYLHSVDGGVIAHEFGHMVGNPDEYNVPGQTGDIPAGLGLSPTEKQSSSVQGITGAASPTKVGGYTMPGIMGQRGEQVAQPRHVGPIMNLFNGTLLQPGEAPFRLA